MTRKPLRKPNSKNPQIESYVGAVKRGLKTQHVTLSSKGWVVKRVNAKRASGVFATQKQAQDAAIRLAKKGKTEVFIHGRDGRIRERNSYGHDPYPPRG